MLTIEYVKNAQWSNPEKTHLTCDIKFEEFVEEFVGYGAIIQDKEPHVVALFEGIESGEFEVDNVPKFTSEEWYNITHPVLPEPTTP